ncbi:MAG: 4-phytase, partial [Alphaproteobacteria bacterium]|nr:4-phytase [Alphaproteobacteria bacterium]
MTIAVSAAGGGSARHWLPLPAWTKGTSPMLTRRGVLAAAGAAVLPGMSAIAAPLQVLRIGMTAADLPSTHGIPNNGGEGFRFLGYPAYDSVINWDFAHTEKLADIAPGLFTAWHADEASPLRWVCEVRQNVHFHDGSAFDADAVIWNLRRIYDDKSPQYDAPAAPIVKATVSMIDSFEKADDKTVVIGTKYPFSFLPYLLTRVLIASPTQWDKVGRNWAAFAKEPSGTGPFKITKVVPGQYAEMSRNE